MISKEKVFEAAVEACETVKKDGDKSLSVAKINVNKANNIIVYLSKDTGVTIEDCVRVSKEMEKHFDRDTEDFSLTVSSLGVK